MFCKLLHLSQRLVFKYNQIGLLNVIKIIKFKYIYFFYGNGAVLNIKNDLLAKIIAQRLADSVPKL